VTGTLFSVHPVIMPRVYDNCVQGAAQVQESPLSSTEISSLLWTALAAACSRPTLTCAQAMVAERARCEWTHTSPLSNVVLASRPSSFSGKMVSTFRQSHITVAYMGNAVASTPCRGAIAAL
jgi:hypothetical protein